MSVLAGLLTRLACERPSHLSVQTVAWGSQVVIRLTVAGTAPDLHGVPY
jgi:hypothetical protein